MRARIVACYAFVAVAGLGVIVAGARAARPTAYESKTDPLAIQWGHPSVHEKPYVRNGIEYRCDIWEFRPKGASPRSLPPIAVIRCFQSKASKLAA